MHAEEGHGDVVIPTLVRLRGSASARARGLGARVCARGRARWLAVVTFHSTVYVPSALSMMLARTLVGPRTKTKKWSPPAALRMPSASRASIVKVAITPHTATVRPSPERTHRSATVLVFSTDWNEGAALIDLCLLGMAPPPTPARARTTATAQR